VRASTLADYEQRILRAQQLLQSRLDEPIEPAMLAKHAGFSLHHFHRIFRALLGESVMEHVRRLRLERAARRLRASATGILELALEAGYESHEAFTRAFAARFGCPPSAFRDQPSLRLVAWEPTRDTRPPVAVRVEEVAPIRVVLMRSRGSYAAVHEVWNRLRAWIARTGNAGPLYGVCPDDPEMTDEALLRFDACVAIADAIDDGEVASGEIPGGSYAIATHVGPFDRLADTYLDVIGRWFPTSGYELAVDAVVEHYLDDPRVVPASQLRTEVCVRIAD
jgi:AraC family transcriptional regulator